ncbi:hypothetical protein [Actinokineospora sp. NBRC 105648]|uniref:hypothetical protein n=1 Tax=Actinokineospora sp. NBRC 105648 TaxID=3032206 RepID=UPI0024A4F061|nr:hypothetical protein [Actinokineospora sp. NBRC 105648]GLZ41429.1 hypothetical protein Acsp05_50530 [Actinokineospora sp. NBRC 105648]
MAYAIDPYLSPTVTPGDFSVSVDPLVLRVQRPGDFIVAVATRAGAEAHPLAFEVRGLPEGVEVEFEPNAITAGQSAKLSFAVASWARVGTYSVTVLASTESGLAARAYASLTVEDPEPEDRLDIVLSSPAAAPRHR